MARHQKPGCHGAGQNSGHRVQPHPSRPQPKGPGEAADYPLARISQQGTGGVQPDDRGVHDVAGNTQSD